MPTSETRRYWICCFCDEQVRAAERPEQPCPNCGNADAFEELFVKDGTDDAD